MEPQGLSKAIYLAHKNQISSFASHCQSLLLGMASWATVATKGTRGASAFHQPTAEWRPNRNSKLLKQKYLPAPTDGELHTLGSALA